MGSQCCKCSNGKNQHEVTRSRPTSINIRFHGNQEISTFRYKFRPDENIDPYKSKTSRRHYISYHPCITDILENKYSSANDVDEMPQRIKPMNNNGILWEPQKSDPPTFIRKLSDLAVKIGTRTRFLVEIQSTSCTKVTWHRNDEPIQLGSHFSLIHEGNFHCIDVAPVTIEDEGYWTCIAENDSGRSSCSCFLNVLIPKAYKKPHFIEELRALLTESGSVSLECKVLGVPTPVLKWFKDGKEMKAGDIFALTASSEDSTSLGIYRCEAVNCMGVACSSSKVHVIDSEDDEKSNLSIKSSGQLPIFKKYLKNESCKIGENLVLSCEIQVPPWPKEVAWYNERGRVESNEKYQIVEDGLGVYSIEIQDLEAIDKGEWKCVATSFENIKQLTTCNISMLIPKNYRIPRFMEDLRAILTEEGLVSFECKVVGFPTPILKWFKDGEELKPGDVYQLTGTNSLGSYCCIARNCMGEAKSTAELTIEDIDKQLNEEERLQLVKECTQVPKFKMGLKCCEAKIDENFTFSVRIDVTLSSEPSISWYRNNELITEDVKYKLIKSTLGNFHLEITNLELIDQAQWKCLAENDFGHSVTSCFLKLIIPKHFRKPKYLENLKAVLSEDGTVSLECKVIGVPQPALTWYKDGIELKPGDIHRIISGGNGTCCLGTYTCRATNCMGSVSSSASLVGIANETKQVQRQENEQLETSAKNVSLSTIHEERTSQLYDTPQTENSVTLDDHGEISFSFDGKEISVSLYETPDLTEEDAIQIVEMYANQLSEHISEGDVIELPPMRFTKETSTTGNLLMEAVVIDVSPDYFIRNEKFEDLRTEVDVEDVSIMDDHSQSNISSYSSAIGGQSPLRPLRKRQKSMESSSSKSDHSKKSHRKSIKTLDLSDDYHSANEPLSMEGQFSLANENISTYASDGDVLSAAFSEKNSLNSNETNSDVNGALQATNLQSVTVDITDNDAIIPKPSSNPSEIPYTPIDLKRINIAMSALEQAIQKIFLLKEENDDSGIFIIAEKLEIIYQCLHPFMSSVRSDRSYGIIENYINELVITTLTEPLEDLAEITIYFCSSPLTNQSLLNDFEKVAKDFQLKLETLVVALKTYENEFSEKDITENYRQLVRHLYCIMNDISNILLETLSNNNTMGEKILHSTPENNESKTDIFDKDHGEFPETIDQVSLILSSIHFELSSILERASANSFAAINKPETSPNFIDSIEDLRQCIGDITITLATSVRHVDDMSENTYDYVANEFKKLRVPLSHLQENLSTREYQPEEIYILKDMMSPISNLKTVILNLTKKHHSELGIIQLLEIIERHVALVAITSSNETLIDEVEKTEGISPSLQKEQREEELTKSTMNMNLEECINSETVSDLARAEKLHLWALTILEPLNRLANTALSLDKLTDDEVHTLLYKPLDALVKQIGLIKSQINQVTKQSLENDVETICEEFLRTADQLCNVIGIIIEIWRKESTKPVVRQNLEEFLYSASDLCEQYKFLQEKLIVQTLKSCSEDQKTNTPVIESIIAVIESLQSINDTIKITLNTTTLETVTKENLSMGISMDNEKQIKYKDIENLNNHSWIEKPSQVIENIFDIQDSLQSEQVSTECPPYSSVPLHTTSIGHEISPDIMPRINQEKTPKIAHYNEPLETKKREIQVEKLYESLPPNSTSKISEKSEIMKNLVEDTTHKTFPIHDALANSQIANNSMIDYPSNYAFERAQISSDVEILEDFQVSLESSIDRIVEDELDRQGRLDCASVDFIKLVQDKVHVTISANSNINRQSTLEDMVRDITVEQLQTVKSNENETTNDNIDISFPPLPEQGSNRTLVKPLQTMQNILCINEEGTTEEKPQGKELYQSLMPDSTLTIIEESKTMKNSDIKNDDEKKLINSTLLSQEALVDSQIVNKPIMNTSQNYALEQVQKPVENNVSQDFQVSLRDHITFIIEDELDRQGARKCGSIGFINHVQEKVHIIMSKRFDINQKSILEEMVRDVTVEELQTIKSENNEVVINDNHCMPSTLVSEQKSANILIESSQVMESILCLNEKEPEEIFHNELEKAREEVQGTELCELLPPPDCVQRFHEKSNPIESLERNHEIDEPIKETFTTHEPTQDFQILNNLIKDNSSNYKLEQMNILPNVAHDNDARENKCLEGSELSLESHITQIIEDELKRQSKPECESIDLIKLIEAKVHATVSKFSNLDQQLLFEETVRDITVKELQCIKSHNNKGTDDNFNTPSILVRETKKDDKPTQQLEIIQNLIHINDKEFQGMGDDESFETTKEKRQANKLCELLPLECAPTIVDKSEAINNCMRNDEIEESINETFTVLERLEDVPLINEPNMKKSFTDVPEQTQVSLDAENNEVGPSFETSLKSDIKHIIEEELDHQDALQHASINFIKLIQDKVQVTISQNLNVDQHSLMEELVRDIIVEELQSIKLRENTTENKTASNESLSLPEYVAADDSMHPIKCKEFGAANQSNVSYDGPTCEKIIEDCQFDNSNKMARNTFENKETDNEDNEKFSFIPNEISLNDQIRKLISIELRNTIVNWIEEKKLVGGIKHNIEKSSLSIFNKGISLENITSSIQNEFEKQLMSIFGIESFLPKTSEYNSETITDIILKHKIEELVIATFEVILEESASQKTLIETIKYNIKEIMKNDGKFFHHSISDRNIEQLIIMELAMRKKQIFKRNNNPELQQIWPMEISMDDSNENVTKELVVRDVEQTFVKVSQDDGQKEWIKSINHVTILNNPLVFHCQFSDHSLEELSSMGSEIQIVNAAQSCDHDELQNIRPTTSITDIALGEAIEPLIISKLESQSAKKIELEQYIDPLKPTSQSIILQNPVTSSQCIHEECTQDLEIAELKKPEANVVTSDASMTLGRELIENISDFTPTAIILGRPSTVDIEFLWEIPKDAVSSEAFDHHIAALHQNDVLQAASQRQQQIFNCPQTFDEMIPNEYTQNMMENYPIDSNVVVADMDSSNTASQHQVNVQIWQPGLVVTDEAHNPDNGNIPEKNHPNYIKKSIEDENGKLSEGLLPVCGEQSSGDYFHKDHNDKIHSKKILSADNRHVLNFVEAIKELNITDKTADDNPLCTIKSVGGTEIAESSLSCGISEEWIQDIILTEFNKGKIEPLMMTKAHVNDFIMDIYENIHEKLEKMYPKDMLEYSKCLVLERLHELIMNEISTMTIRKLEEPSKYKRDHSINLHVDDVEIKPEPINIMGVYDGEIRNMNISNEEVVENFEKNDRETVNGSAENLEKTAIDQKKLEEILNSQQDEKSHEISGGTYGESDLSNIQQQMTSMPSATNDKLSKRQVVEPNDCSIKPDKQLKTSNIMLDIESKNILSKDKVKDVIEKHDEVLNDISKSNNEQQLTVNNERDFMREKNLVDANVKENQVSRKEAIPSNSYEDEARVKRQNRQKSRMNEQKLFESHDTMNNEIHQVHEDYEQSHTEREILNRSEKVKKIGYTKTKEADNIPQILERNVETMEKLTRNQIPPSEATDKLESSQYIGIGLKQRYMSDIESYNEDLLSKLDLGETNVTINSESSESSVSNMILGELKERDTSSFLPSISIDIDEFMTNDRSQYSDLSDKKLDRYQKSDADREYLPGPRNKGKKPIFCMKLIDRTAAAESRIKLTCTVLGDPEPFMLWMHNSRELLQTSNRYCITNDNGVVSLEIYSVRPQDSGDYTCSAKNIYGEAYTEAKLKVYAGYESTQLLPIFTRPMKDTFKFGDDKLVLECRVRAQPPPVITWLKDGKIIEMNDRYRQSDLAEGICRLQISNPGDYDNGLYTCRAENKSGFSECNSHFTYHDNAVTPNSDGASMRTHKKRPILTTEMHSTMGYDMYSSSLLSSDSSDFERSNDTYRTDKTFGNIEYGNVKFDGGYLYLRENGKPATFISRPVDKVINACVGEDVSLSFRVGGVPKPKVILMKGLVDITNGARSYKESHDDYVRITFKRIEYQDEGTYCILVKNRYGYDRSFFTIRIKQRARSLTPARSTEWNFENMNKYLSHSHEPKPSEFKFIPGPISSEPVVIDGGKTWLALSWGKAEQRGPASIIAYRVDAWLLGGDCGARWIELGVTSTNSFDAFNLCPGKEYKFRITPRNQYGWGESVTMTNSVIVKEIIKFPEFSKMLPSQLKALEGTTLKLDCEINNNKSSTHIRWYKDSAELDGTHDPRFIIHNIDSKCSLSIVDIKEIDSGRYVCDATNVAGRVSTFARVQVVTDPKIADADEKLRTMRTIDSMSEERSPEFTMRLRDRRVQATYPVRLTCQVDGNPEPVVTWYKDEEKIDIEGMNCQVENMSISKDEAHFHTLEISRSKIDNTGNYMVRAQNVHGCLSCRCHLIVDEGIRAYIAPQFTHLLNSIYTVIQNHELRMTAQLEAYPAVGITWYRNGKRLRPNRNTVMSLHHDGTVELTLAHVSYKDSGFYCCIATNEVGQAESKTQIHVLTNGYENDVENSLQLSMEIGQSSNIPYSKEPVFITKPLSTDAFEGDNIIIVCQVIGDPEPDVIWLRDFLRPDYYKDAPHFRPVGLGPQYQLEIPYAKLDFTGTYSVIAKNCFGEAKAVISLQIYARDPERQEINRKQTVKHSEIQTLPVIKSPLKNIRCCDGDAVTFICKVDATPPPCIRWERGNKLVPLQDDVIFDFENETAQLHIQQVYPEDEGEYVCVVYNDLGSAYTSACLIVDVPEGKEISINRRLKKPIRLLSPNATPISTPRSTPIRSLSPACVMREPTQKTGRRPRMPAAPKFYAIPHNRVAEEGDTIRFQCAVTGHPTPWANWDKDGTTVISTARISIREKDDLRILEIVQITYEDAGLYRITLENDIGRVEATARLEVIRGKQGSISRGIAQTSSRQIHLTNDRPHNHAALTAEIKCAEFNSTQSRKYLKNLSNLSSPFENALSYLKDKFDSKDTDKIHTPAISSALLAIYSRFLAEAVQWFHKGQEEMILNDHIKIQSIMGLSHRTLKKITCKEAGKYSICLEDAVGRDLIDSSIVISPRSITTGNGIPAVSECGFQVSDIGKSQIGNITKNRMDNSSMKTDGIDEEDSEDLGETSQSFIVEVMPRYIFDAHFDTLEEIGKGRYGVVRKVIDKSTKIHRAAKFVRTIKAKDRQQVLKEIDIMNAMNHPKLLRLITAFEGSKEMIMVTEYISGGELFERVVADDFTLTEKDSILFVRQICEGVAYMHDKHIVHMDLKPENIMCQSRTCHRIKLIDFGLAQMLTPNTPVRVLFGTPEFVSPEIISFEPIGPESDMWSIGVICYVLLTGLSPFMGESDAETFVNITRADYDFDDEAFIAISKEALDFISSLLIKKKELRRSARNCLTHPWLTQCAEKMSQVVLSTDKLKNFIIRRKWQIMKMKKVRSQG
ncbi:uncharacterized protein LOC107045269 isoform X3 [Diachasma alloeum]|uniref:uncharacterized protein LOC107045269 isoform X3 n=1 Tax=Diachasma alloeum TaxID=454923 RepID=UPI00073838BC|nr:uncharacterized protein LOC107045269 isoform X3 [Diachasma alloeum]